MFKKLKSKPSVSEFDVSAPPEFGSAAVVTNSTPLTEPKVRSLSISQNLSSQQKPSVVSEGFVIRGDIESAGILHVEGSVIGTLKADDVNVGVAGLVDGTLTCKNLSVKGQLSGMVVCDELVIAPSAHIKGEISYASLTIGSGATIDCEMTCRSPSVG